MNQIAGSVVNVFHLRNGRLVEKQLPSLVVVIRVRYAVIVYADILAVLVIEQIAQFQAVVLFGIRHIESFEVRRIIVVLVGKPTEQFVAALSLRFGGSCGECSVEIGAGHQLHVIVYGIEPFVGAIRITVFHGFFARDGIFVVNDVACDFERYGELFIVRICPDIKRVIVRGVKLESRFAVLIRVGIVVRCEIVRIELERYRFALPGLDRFGLGKVK